MENGERGKNMECESQKYHSMEKLLENFVMVNSIMVKFSITGIYFASL